MPVLHIILKDLARALRSPQVLAFMLVLPLAEAGLPYLAFSGLASGFDVQRTRVLIVNLDLPVAEYPGLLAGGMLADMFREESLQDLLETADAESEAAARAAVDAREADAAVIIPADFTASLFREGATTEVEIYHDPALTLGPAIVHDVVTGFLDGFTGTLIAADTAGRDAPLEPPAREELMRRYGEWARRVGERLEGGGHPALAYRLPSGARETGRVMEIKIGPVMVGMLVFFAFFVGAVSAQSILREQEQGTLARLCRTPLSQAAILAGKAAAVALLLALQAGLLIAVGGALFGIAWGDPLSVMANVLGLMTAAGGFGVMLISFMRTTRQAFLVMGGAVMLTGMAGGTMTTTFADLPGAFTTLNLLTPQGWIVRGFTAAMNGASFAEAAVPALVAVGTGAAFYAIASWKISRRWK
ncbi:MAG: ABC transporter permease [Anaerolineales bacterium]|nr:ABC transporter permease [Anaerolineales bacterium]